MMTKASVSILMLAGLFFAASFAGTVATTSPGKYPRAGGKCSPLVRWLDLDPDQKQAVEDRDSSFTADQSRLQGKLWDARTALACVFDEPDSTDEDIRRSVEAVIEAHNRLERRVADHVIAVRALLKPEQQKRLFSRCAKEVRRCCGKGMGRNLGQDTGPACSQTPEYDKRCNHGSELDSGGQSKRDGGGP